MQASKQRWNRLLYKKKAVTVTANTVFFYVNSIHSQFVDPEFIKDSYIKMLKQMDTRAVVQVSDVVRRPFVINNFVHFVTANPKNAIFSDLVFM